METVKERGKRVLRRALPRGAYSRAAGASSLFRRAYWYNSNPIVETTDRVLKATLPVGLYEWTKRRLCFLIKNFWYYEYAERDAFFRRAFKALSFNGIDGDYFEFGSYRASTFRMAYRWSRRHNLNTHLMAFDSFAGLPEGEGGVDTHPQWVQGEMSTDLKRFRAICRSAGISDKDYGVVQGFYNETLTRPEAQDLPTNVCMVYVDCDLYSSTNDVLKFIAPRLKHGMIIAFDDYFCYSKTEDAGERRACEEFFAQHPEWTLLPFHPYAWGGMSFIVQKTSAARTSSGPGA